VNAVAFRSPLADVPSHSFQNGLSAKFVLYFAPVLEWMVRINTSARGRVSLLLSCAHKKEGFAQSAKKKLSEGFR